MIFRGVSNDGDWKFGKGKQDYTRDKKAIELNILTRIKSWKGNCFFAQQDGVDYNNYMDVGTKQFLDRDVLRVVLQSEGVVNIIDSSFMSEITDRTYTAEMSVNTIFGILEVLI